METGTRYGDSRKPMAAAWKIGTEERPRVGTSKVYQGKEVEAANQSKIGGLSPGPAYMYGAGKRNEVDGQSNYHAAPSYTIGGTRVDIDKRDSPGPCNYGFAQARSLGFQRINSQSNCLPRWGFGTSTREHREMIHIAKGRLFSNNLPTRTLVFPPDGQSVVPSAHNGTLPAGGGFADGATKSTLSGTALPEPSRATMGRALAVAMTAQQTQADPVLAGALAALHSRVATLKQQGGQA